MKFTTLTSAWAASAMIQSVTAYPGMDKTLAEIRERANGPDQFDSTELIGDLNTSCTSCLSPVGTTVKNVIVGSLTGQSTNTWTSSVPTLGSANCKQDTCCVWQYVSNDMQKAFRGSSGRCNNLARAAIRLGFHDAAGWSKYTGNFGGADGSLVLAPAEIQRIENNGLQDIVAQMKTWYGQYNSYGVGMADLIQMGATVATVTCPLGPRIRSYVGRKDSNVPCPNGLLPGVNQDANALIKLFQDKTIAPHGLTALIGAHTTSQQQFVDPARAGDPQDSTPGVWDVLFYKQTLNLVSTPARVFKFASDIALSKDSRISQEFAEFAGNGGQEHWNEDYAREYVRLSMLGVFNINNLTDCSKVLPARISSYNAPDQTLLTKWLSTTTHSSTIANAVMNGSLLSEIASIITGWLNALGFRF